MFSELKVKEIKRETEDSVSIVLDVPESLRSNFSYASGQYITIKSLISGEDIRRAYSLCSAPFEVDFRIGVKKVMNGKMSTYLNDVLKEGDSIEVMSPAGNFTVEDGVNNAVGFAAGSGITPILSMIKSVLNEGKRFTLFYGNQTTLKTIFKKELDGLEQEYPENFKLHYLYTKENTSSPLYEGRIDKEKTIALLQEDSELLNVDGFYICGPEELIMNASDALKELGVDSNKVHFELFTAPSVSGDNNKVVSDFTGESQVTVIMDGDEFEFPLRADGDFILDASMENGADAPFSCKGAVCCTCKAQVLEGKATMDMNYSLSDEEVEEGFILTCQARPASEKLVVDYDVI